MKETSLKPVIEKLESLFSKFNEKFYNNELQTPVITVSPDNEQMGRIHKLFVEWCKYVAEDGTKPFADYTFEKFFEVMMQSGSFHTMNRHIENMEYENGLKRKG